MYFESIHDWLFTLNPPLFFFFLIFLYQVHTEGMLYGVAVHKRIEDHKGPFWRTIRTFKEPKDLLGCQGPRTICAYESMCLYYTFHCVYHFSMSFLFLNYLPFSYKSICFFAKKKKLSVLPSRDRLRAVTRLVAWTKIHKTKESTQKSHAFILSPPINTSEVYFLFIAAILG